MAMEHFKSFSGIIFGLQILVIFLEIRTTVSQCNECPDGWLRYKTSCYYFSSNVGTLSFSESTAFCKKQNINAHLVAVETLDEKDFIRDNLRRYYETENNYWLGATDTESEGTWVWAHSGAQIAISDWAPGQPNDWHHLEDCAAFDGEEDGQWKDFVCDGQHRPLCELEFTDSATILG